MIDTEKGVYEITTRSQNFIMRGVRNSTQVVLPQLHWSYKFFFLKKYYFIKTNICKF